MRATLLALLLLVPVAAAHVALPGAVVDAGAGADDPALPEPPLRELAHRVGLSQQAHTLAPASGTEFGLDLVCPQPPLGVAASPCPFRVVDAGDILGNPGLAVDPVVPGRIAFASLHGQPAGDASTLRREGQTHTTFTTLAFGLNWEDQPYTPPSPPADGGRQVYGEDVHALIDASRTLHVASLYSHRGSDGGAWNTSIVMWKFDQEARRLDYGATLAVFDNRVAGGRIETMWLVELPDAGLVALVWRESAPPERPIQVAGQNVTSWLSAAVTPADSASPWVPLPTTTLLPCERSTNPVGHRTRVYMGCQNATTGETRLFALDLSMKDLTDLGASPIVGGDARIAVTPQGRLAMLSVDVVNRTLSDEERASENATLRTVRAQLAFSDLGEDWTDVRDVPLLHNASRDVVVSRVNAMLYSNRTDTLHLVYFERHPDTKALIPALSKRLVVVDTLGSVLLDLDLEISEKGEVFGGGGPSNPGVFADTRDSLILVSGREYVAWADHGVVVFAELVEKDRRIYSPPQTMSAPIAEPAPVVQSAALTTTTGVTVGFVAAAAAARLVTVQLAKATGAGRRKR